MFVQLLNQNATNILEKTRRFMAFQVSVTHGFLLTPFCHRAVGVTRGRRGRHRRGKNGAESNTWTDKGEAWGWWLRGAPKERVVTGVTLWGQWWKKETTEQETHWEPPKSHQILLWGVIWIPAQPLAESDYSHSSEYAAPHQGHRWGSLPLGDGKRLLGTT